MLWWQHINMKKYKYIRRATSQHSYLIKMR